jgi:hypothetical protein
MLTSKTIELGRVSEETREMGPGLPDNPLSKHGPVTG